MSNRRGRSAGRCRATIGTSRPSCSVPTDTGSFPTAGTRWPCGTPTRHARSRKPRAAPSFDRFAISPNGKFFVVAEGLDLRRFDALTGEPIGSPMRGHTSVMVSSITVTNDGRFIVSGGADQTLRFWDAATGEPVGEPLKGRRLDHRDPCRAR
ncbi:hypothetical protein FXW78_22650 [Rhodococcus opacus]|nr:hypothetical protein [Rhodococcus opacus]